MIRLLPRRALSFIFMGAYNNWPKGRAMRTGCASFCLAEGRITAPCD